VIYCYILKPKKGKLMKFKYIVIVIAVVLLFTACNTPEVNSIVERGEDAAAVIARTDLIIGTGGMRGEFSPFFTRNTDSFGDAGIMRTINLPLVTLDRRGAVVRNAGSGEVRDFDGADYNYLGIADVDIRVETGDADTTTFTFFLREDVYFSDGVRLTADDIIFTLYVLSDVDYDGDFDVSLLPIEGLELYRADADRQTYERYREIFEECLAWYNRDTDEDEPDTDEEEDEFSFTEEQYTLFGKCYYEAWQHHVNAIVSYSVRNYTDYAGLVNGNDVALAMMVWRAADIEEDDASILTSVISGRRWNLEYEFPTMQDFFNEFHRLYDGNLEAYINAERIGVRHLDDVFGEAMRRFIGKSAELYPVNIGANSISGIRKIGDFEVSVTLNGQLPGAIYSFVFPVAPRHYYGDMFIRGNLSALREHDGLPLGAGPYRLTGFDGQTAELEANPYYYKGVSEITHISFTEVNRSDLIYGIAAEDIDITVVPAVFDVFNEINAYINNGADIIWQEAYSGALGYIGINAERVNISLPPDYEPDIEPDDNSIDPALSTASINFRKGIAIILAAYREVSVMNFYGDTAGIAQYPVSGVSWAAPRNSDPDYRTAFSLTTHGGEIYSYTMTESMRIESAKRAALDFFEAAGLELNSTRTAVAAFPEGMKRTFEVYIHGEGTGNHPSYLLLTMAAETLGDMNVNLVIRDVRSQGEMFEAVMNGQADIWCAAWNGQVLSGLDNNFMSAGGENFFGLASEIIDMRILLAYATLDPGLYISVMDAVLDAAVIVPVYQRKLYFVFGSALDPDTIEGSLTTHYGFTEIIERIRLV